MSKNVAIRIDGLWKQYGLPIGHTIRSYVKRLKRGRGFPGEYTESDNDSWALKNIHVEISPGEVLGIIGRNGAGKSTLLKVLSGVTPPTRGNVVTQGRIFPMIELNAGINPELTGRENISLLGAIMGIHRQELRAKMPEIEEFCELEQWLDRPVRMYSTGMLARLGFAVAVNVNAKILLIDEVLAVGDMSFQRKCFNRIEQIHTSGNTVVLVSHNIRQIERLCDKVLLLECGNQIAYGKPIDVISQYYEATNSKILEQQFPDGETLRVLQTKVDDAVVDLLSVRLLNHDGNPITVVQTGESLTVEVSYHSHQPLEHTIIGVAIMTVDSFYISGFTNEQTGFKMPLRGQGTFRFTIKTLPLLSGLYMLALKIKHPNGGILGGGNGLASFRVSIPEHLRLSSDYGLITMDTQWEKTV